MRIVNKPSPGDNILYRKRVGNKYKETIQRVCAVNDSFIKTVDRKGNESLIPYDGQRFMVTDSIPSSFTKITAVHGRHRVPVMRSKWFLAFMLKDWDLELDTNQLKQAI